MRWIAVVAAIVLALGYFALTMASSSQLSTGPLSAAHAHTEHNCQACHGNAWGLSIAADAWRPARQRTLDHLETACQECHRVESHFRDKLIDDYGDRNCTACHREHLGREHDMADVANQRCVACHGQLAEQCRSTPHTARSTITGFSLESHPDFRSLEKDLGRIHFNHQQHMLPGQVPTGGPGGFKSSFLDEKWRRVYSTEGGPDGLVQLKCADCHRGDDSRNAGPGANHAPVKYEQHCIACHPLNYEGRERGESSLPHAVSWREMKKILSAKIVGSQLAGVIDRDQKRSAPLPGPDVTTSTDQRDQLDDLQLQAAVLQVRGQCLKCHREEDLADAAMENPSERIRQRWLQFGLFDHAAHRHIDCQNCHDFEADQTAADEHVVVIKGIESCVGCHREPNEPLAESLAASLPQPNWASHNCILCHRYHGSRSASTSTDDSAGAHP